jgi:hypothetical protein
MTRGLSSKQRRRPGILLGSFLILIVAAGLSGCMPSSTSQEQVACTSNTGNVNIFKVKPQPWVNEIYQYAALPAVPISDANLDPMSIAEQQIQNARYAAFQYLVEETERWSDTQIIKLDDSREVQLTVTFISPELVEAVYLSEVLKHRLYLIDFEAQAQAAMNYVAMRDELLFLLTITITNTGSPDNPPHIIDIPIRQMFIINGEDLQVEPGHDDHNLDQPIRSSSEPVYGYLGYPLSVKTSDNECKWVLEPRYNTNIVIATPFILKDSENIGPFTWTIPYSALIDAHTSEESHKFDMPSTFDQNLLSPSESPPLGISQTEDWSGLARFIWCQLILENY